MKNHAGTALVAIVWWAAVLSGTLQTTQAAERAFTATDLVNLDRVSEPRVRPDGRGVVFTLRETDFAANLARRRLWSVDLGQAQAVPAPLTSSASNAWSPRWSRDGRWLYFLSNRTGSSQVWRLQQGMGEAQAVTNLPLDVDSFVLAPNDRQIALAVGVFADCADLTCTRQRLDAQAASKSSGVLYQKLFVRHWDTWSDGTRSQLFVADLDGSVVRAPRRLTNGIDGDVPSKPFGDDTEYSFAADSRSIYFDVRIAGTDEPWSTNFDVYVVPVDGSAAARDLTADNLAWDAYPLPSSDGKKLYYLAMQRPQHEADRFHIMELDLGSGRKREIAADWDRSAGALQLSADGRTLYTTADDRGERPLFAIDIASGTVKRLAAGGTVSDYSSDAAGKVMVFAREALNAPTDLYQVAGPRHAETRLTQVNAARLKDVRFSDSEVFRFKGWNDESVQGYVVKPFGYQPGHQYPVVFMIHGGPQGSWLNEFHYRWNPQTYAGAGFAVVAIDFHGSTGYGQAFTDAISGHWGDRPLEDLQKGWAAALAQFPFLAGERACAIGASYGGYMVDWIAGNWPKPVSGPWKCLVSHDGVFDTRMMYFSTEELWFEEVENAGTPWDQPQNYERFNPAVHVGAWQVPMMIVQGGRDFRIPLEQGLSAFTALQRRGIPSQLLYFPDENHWVLKPQNSLEWHQAVEAWLKRWTGP